MKGFHKRGGAQWANLGGQTLQLKWLVNCKDPMHDCNRFLWQILHTTGEHWTDISKCIYWMLNPRRWTHQITKYWRWPIHHLYWSAQPERHLLVKGKRNLLHRLNNCCGTQSKLSFNQYTELCIVVFVNVIKYVLCKCKEIKCWIQNEWCSM